MNNRNEVLETSDPWKDVMHDLKVAIMPIMLALEELQRQEPNPSFLSLMETLTNIAHKSITDLRSSKEPDGAKRLQLLNEYKEELREALRQTEGLTLSDTNKKSELISFVNEARSIVDGSVPRPDTLLGPLLYAKLSSHKRQLEESKNTTSLTFSPADLEKVIVKGSQVNLIKSIVANCIENATKYAMGSPIEISIRSVTLPDGESTFQIIVNDKGPGMSSGVLQRVREGVNVTTTGNGVGLSGLTNRVNHMGGRVTVTSSDAAVDHGTQFIWELPLNQILSEKKAEPVSPEKNADSVSSQDKSNGERYALYLIDDSLANLRGLTKKMEYLCKQMASDYPLLKHLSIVPHENADFLNTLSADEAKEIVCIMADLNLRLKDHDGITIACELKPKIHKNARIHILTGDDHEEVITHKNYSPEVITNIFMKGILGMGDFKAILQDIAEHVLQPKKSTGRIMRALQKQIDTDNVPLNQVPSIGDVKSLHTVISAEKKTEEESVNSMVAPISHVGQDEDMSLNSRTLTRGMG